VRSSIGGGTRRACPSHLNTSRTRLRGGEKLTSYLQAEDEKKRRSLDGLFCTGLLDGRKSAAKTLLY